MRLKSLMTQLSFFVLIILGANSSFGQSKPLRLLDVEKNGKCGYMNQQGVLVIDFQFDSCWKFSEGFAAVTVNKKIGFINEEGKLISKSKFNNPPSYFHEGFATVKIGNFRKGKEKNGVIDTKGEITIFDSVSYINDFSEGLASFEKNKLYGYIDKSLKIAIEPKFNYAGKFSDGLARVTGLDGSDYYIDKTGKKVLDIDGSDFSEGFAFIKSDRKYGFINKSGETVIQPQFDFATFFYEGLVAVEIDDKWGFVDSNGKTIIPFQFDEVDEFSEGLAGVRLKDKWGFIDKTGQTIIPFEYEATDGFENGIGSVKINDKWQYIEKSGKLIQLQSK
jgi:hypothetical protein